jgi:3-deoxy-manno-octulosonate cytidylyltransferase (CMP-KDO synthetase)
MVAIPARFESTRFPGKPLADIFGKPMLQRVWERCVAAVGSEKVVVLTDDNRITALCDSIGARFELVMDACATGTDRICKSRSLSELDFVVNVQGDEPLVNPDHVKLTVSIMLDPTENVGVVNLMTPIASEDEYLSLDVPKCVTNLTGELLYMSRAAIPGSKDGAFRDANRQVCVYGFSRGALADYIASATKTPLERIEDIEILRFLELGHRVIMRRVEHAGPGIDRPSDIEKLKRDDFA